jgi:hypothetical protein
MSLSEDLVRKISKTTGQYRRRVYTMAAVYVLLNVTAFASILIIVWQYRLFVTLSQRSNVETLTLAIILVLFAYLIFTTFAGFIGALKMLFYNLPLGGGGADDSGSPGVAQAASAKAGQQAADTNQGRTAHRGKQANKDADQDKEDGAAPPLSPDRRRVEARKQAALKPAKEQTTKAYYNYAFASQEDPDAPIRIPIGDEAGTLGELVIDGAEAKIEAEKQGISNTLFEYLLNQLQDRLRQRAPEVELEIVAWSSVNDEAAAMYKSQVQAFRTLADQLEKGPIWPTLEVTAADVAFLEQRIRAIVPYLRDECFLPDVEYEAEYSIPIIPEPLGFISLRRTEQRADPVATMGCAALVTLGILALLVFFLVFPPWIPGK